MLGELSALGASLTIAGSAVISKSLAAKIKPLTLQTLRCWFGCIFLVTVCFILGKADQLTHIPLLLMGMLVASAFIGIATGDSLYMKTLSLAEASRVFPVVRGSQIVFTMIAAALFLGEEVTPATVTGAILIMSGVYLATFTETSATPNPAARPAPKTKWLPLAMAVGLCWTLSLCLMKIVLRDIDPLLANSFRLPVAALMLTSLVLMSGRGESLRIERYGRIGLGLAITAGVLSYGIGVLLELYAIYFAGISRAAILTSWTPLFVLFLSVLFLREKLTMRLGLGTLLCSGGTALIMAL